ncbi:hypothetical protein [Dyadobacter bucti]|uniref:hypothetical protein n=1 Tax=Dyadobacter bucti TaxID=2572203 RepID=UPI001109A862|nr:hypothetical protein [Dyadobacter bucti]
MLSVYRNEPAPNLRSVAKKSSFDRIILDFKRLYPTARLVQNYGHTFLIDETVFLFIAFKGTRAQKPVVFTSFKNLKALNIYYYSFVNKLLKITDSKRLRRNRAVKKNEREIQPGEIFYTAPGCDQINIEFFQIIAVKGRSVTIQKIKQIRTYLAMDHGLAIGVKDSFIDVPVRLRIGVSGMRIDAVQYLSHWDNKAVCWSSCA